MKKQVFVTTMAVMLFLVPATLNAQRGGGWGKNCQYCTQYDVKNLQEYKGEIVKIDQFVPTKGMGNGYEITISIGTGEQTVHVGPIWYVQDQELQLQVGDLVEVTGCEINFNGKMVIMAGEIERNEMKMVLRNAQGQPMWW